MDSCHGNPSPSDPMESVCRHFPPPPQLYFAVYLLSLSRTVSRRSDGLLPRQPVSIGSDGVRLPTFSTPSSATLCCIFTKSLANCLPVSLVAHGLLPSDSVWVYWTTLCQSVKSSKFLSFLEDTSHPKSVFSLFLPTTLPSSLQNSENKKVARLKSTSLICGGHLSNVCAKSSFVCLLDPFQPYFSLRSFGNHPVLMIATILTQ